MARDNVYDNMLMAEDDSQPKGNTSKTWVPRPCRIGGIATPVLVLLILVLAISLLAVTLLYTRDRSKLQAVEEAVQKLSVSLQSNTTSAVSAKEWDTLQLLDEAQAGFQMLNARLSNASEEYKKMQARLDSVTGARAAAVDPCRDSLTKLSRGWKFYKTNLYYFSRDRKSWEEAERFCVSQNSHLTSVSSQEEQDFLRKETKGENHWIGLTDLGTEGSWRWVDGMEFRENASSWAWEDLQPDNWHQGEGGREDCVQTRLKGWNDASCALPVKWVCKQPFGQAGL